MYCWLAAIFSRKRCNTCLMCRPGASSPNFFCAGDKASAVEVKGHLVLVVRQVIFGQHERPGARAPKYVSVAVGRKKLGRTATTLSSNYQWSFDCGIVTVSSSIQARTVRSCFSTKFSPAEFPTRCLFGYQIEHIDSTNRYLFYLR